MSEVIQHLVVMVGVALVIGGSAGMLLRWQDIRDDRRNHDDRKERKP